MTTNILAALAACVAAITIALSAGGSSTPTNPTPPPLTTPSVPLSDEALATLAERTFFDALNHHPERREEALSDLRAAARANPANGKLALWLGLCHLWIAAESTGADPVTLDHAVLAEHFLARAQRLLPEDDRIASWLAPARMTIAGAEADADAAARAREQLDRAFAGDPCFHAVAVGITSFGGPRESPAFAAGLEAMRRAAACAGDDPSIQNRERWPHNLEGFSLMLAQYELKAGNRQRAEAMLMFAQSRASYPRWPGRARAEQLLERLKDALTSYANDDPRDDQPLVTGPGSAVSCRICHQTSNE